MNNMKGVSIMYSMKKYLSLLLILVLVLTHAPLSALAESGLGETGDQKTEEALDQTLDDEFDDDLELNDEDLEVTVSDSEEEETEVI